MIAERRGALLFSAGVFVGAITACNSAFRFDEPQTIDSLDGGDEANVAHESGPVACKDDSTCPGKRCDSTTGTCVTCVGDADCWGVWAHCDPGRHLCVECVQTADCGDRYVCDGTTHRCLEACRDADDLCSEEGFVCDVGLHICIECRSSANCAGAQSGMVCDLPIGRCVECTGNAECPIARPICDRRNGACVAP
jgi:hypothetical protein